MKTVRERSKVRTKRRSSSNGKILSTHRSLLTFPHRFLGTKWIRGRGSGRNVNLITAQRNPAMTLPMPEYASNKSSSRVVKLENDVLSVDTGSNGLMSKPLTAEPKPRLRKHPPIWSVSRQEVCETFDWFRSYQGGVYFSKDVVKGYLLGGFSSRRDGFFLEGRLIISHGGGKSESLSSVKGHMKLQGAGNQTAGDKSVRALLNNYERGLPLVLLVDHKYTHFPYDLRGSNISYAVLGLYFIAHAWAEREIVGGKNVIRYKFAFHWIDNADPWWWEKDNSMDVAMATGSSDELVYPSEDGGLPRRTPEKDRVEPLSKRRPSRDTSLYSSCRQCGIDSPQVFAIGWTCLNATCVAFWTHAGTSPPEECVYNTQFLQLLPFPNNLREELKDIRPSEPMTAPRDGITTIKSFTRGFHCQNCGRLSCRFKWQQWECSNCGQTLQVQGKMRPANDLRNIHSGIALKEYVNPFSGIRRLPRRTFSDKNISGEIDTFELPDGSGNIYHVKTPAMRLAPLDEIFLEYQKQADRGELLFRRWPLRSHKLQGELLTHYFSHNCGEPYHYVGGAANTVPWDQAPGAVVKARDFIGTRTSQAIGSRVEFNEVLSAAYMEDQKMSFHTDDEPGLGPTVAGLSLGSPALMHFRRRGRGPSGKHESVLTVVLRHGDVLVMHGNGVQKNYEHTVVPVDFRIAATARYIDPKRKLK